MFSSFVKHNNFKDLNSVSAGFVNFNIKDGNVVLLQYGESDSLGIKSQESNLPYLNMLVNGYCIITKEGSFFVNDIKKYKKYFYFYTITDIIEYRLQANIEEYEVCTCDIRIDRFFNAYW